MITTPTYTDPVRFVTVFNTEATPVPPFALMRVTNITDDGILEIAKPNGANLTSLLANGSTPIPARDYGQGSFSFPTTIALKQEGSNPVIGDTLGTVNGRWELEKGQLGFQVMAVQPGDTVNRVFADKRFSFGTQITEHYGYKLVADLAGQGAFAGVSGDQWQQGFSPYTTVTGLPPFPSEGYWFAELTMTGRIKCEATSGQTRIPVSFGLLVTNYNGCTFLAPCGNGGGTFSVNGYVASARATDASGDFIDQHTLTLPMVIFVAGSIRQLALGFYGHPDVPNYFPYPNLTIMKLWVYAQSAGATVVGNAPVTHFRMMKLRER